MLVKDLIADLEKGNRVNEMLKRKEKAVPNNGLTFESLDRAREAMEEMQQAAMQAPTPQYQQWYTAGTGMGAAYTTAQQQM